MTQETLFDVTKNHHHKNYTCNSCHGYKTVNWEEKSKIWVCSACGKVDRKRTRKEKTL